MEGTFSRILIHHPETSDSRVKRLEVCGVRHEDGLLRLTYFLEGELDYLRLEATRCGDPLWQHTCLEAFIAIQDESAYHEFNFAPSREWAAHAFRSYRERTDWNPSWDPRIQVEANQDRLTLDVTIPLGVLSPLHRNASLRLALSAVIEDESGVLSYWALRHPPGKPDFHHGDAFALHLDAP